MTEWDCHETWIDQAKRGDALAFDRLFRSYRPSVALVVQRVLGSRSAVEDVVQDTFLQAFRALPQLRDTSKFAGWLMAIARHRAIRVSKMESRERPVEFSQLDRKVLREIEASRMDECDEHWEWVLARFQDLPDEIRQAAELHYLHGWPIAKIASQLDLTGTTVKWRLHRCRELLRKSHAMARGQNHA
ncbi:MAG: RNA polymerase sigma factor [Fimbriimonas sp.]